MKTKTRQFSILAISLLVSLAMMVAACGETESETNNANTNNQTPTAGFDIEIDEAASTLEVEWGESVEIAFVVENTGDADATATVSFSVATYSDEMEIEVAGGSAASGSFTWEPIGTDAGTYTAEVAVGDATDSVSVTINQDTGGNAGANQTEENQTEENQTEENQTEVTGPFFAITIDETASTLEVDEGEMLIIMIVATNTGDEDGVLDISGQVAIEGGGVANLELEPQGGDINTPIPPNQGVQIEAQLPTGDGAQQLSTGEHTLTINSQHDSATVPLVVN